MNCVFRFFLDLSTQFTQFEDKQEYKMFETGVLVGKSVDMEPYHPIFNIGSIMLKAK